MLVAGERYPALVDEKPPRVEPRCLRRVCGASACGITSRVGRRRGEAAKTKREKGGQGAAGDSDGTASSGPDALVNDACHEPGKAER
jgi:hypothetical protein